VKSKGRVATNKRPKITQSDRYTCVLAQHILMQAVEPTTRNKSIKHPRQSQADSNKASRFSHKPCL